MLKMEFGLSLSPQINPSPIDVAPRGESSLYYSTLHPTATNNNEIKTELYNDTNNSHNDTFFDYVPYSMRPETYIVPILFAIIFIIGVVGNGTLILIFIKHRTMRNVPNMYIVSLAVGDLFVILFCVPFTSTVYTLESWPYGEFVCKFSEFIKDMSIGVSVFTLTALSADRYFAIADPMRKLHGRRATRITCVTIAGIWLLSIAFAMPSAIFSFVRAMDQDPIRIFYVCYPFPPYLSEVYPQMMVLFHFLVYYAIPLAFIGTFYIGLWRNLVAVAVLIMIVIFALCFFPSHLFMIHFYFNADPENSYNDFWHACRITGFCLSFINSCINPITLYCVSGTFRKMYNEHLFCCCCGSSNPRRRGQRQVMLPTRQHCVVGGFACACSLTGIQPNANAGSVPIFKNGHSPREHHRVQSFRERDKTGRESTAAVATTAVMAQKVNAQVSPTKRQSRSQGSLQCDGGNIALTHKYNKTREMRGLDYDHSC